MMKALRRKLAKEDMEPLLCDPPEIKSTVLEEGILEHDTNVDQEHGDYSSDFAQSSLPLSTSYSAFTTSSAFTASSVSTTPRVVGDFSQHLLSLLSRQEDCSSTVTRTPQTQTLYLTPSSPFRYGSFLEHPEEEASSNQQQQQQKEQPKFCMIDKLYWYLLRDCGCDPMFGFADEEDEIYNHDEPSVKTNHQDRVIRSATSVYSNSMRQYRNETEILSQLSSPQDKNSNTCEVHSPTSTFDINQVILNRNNSDSDSSDSASESCVRTLF